MPIVQQALIQMVKQKDFLRVHQLLTNITPVNWYSVDSKCEEKYPAAYLASDFNMHDGWTFGTLDLDTMNCSLFFFGGPRVERNTRISKILEYIIPFYSEAFKRVLKFDKSGSYSLTPREIEILNWIKEGKSSWDISVILNCSKRTVDFHVTNIKSKLNSVSRAQAVAVGLNAGIIKF